MTMCNMSIEGGARVGYVNPDDTTAAYLEGRPFAPQGEAFERARAWWKSMASDADAHYDDRVTIDGSALEPDRDVGREPGPVHRRRRTDAVAGRRRAGRAAGRRRRARLHGLRGRARDRSDADRRRLHRLVHQLAPVRSARSGGDREGPPRGAARPRDGRAGLAGVRARPPSPRASIRSSATPASNGAAPAARCAWA